MKLLDKICHAWARRNGMVYVPESWQVEYVKLAGDKVRNGQTTAMIVREYNELLKDFYNKCSIKELKDLLKDAELKIDKDLDKDGLVNLAYNEYKMVIKKD
jgi:hypothetical protein